MKIFDRPGPVNTEDVVEMVCQPSLRCKYIVVASLSGDSAVKIASHISDKRVICVTCPQGMHWDVDGMTEGPFAEIPELISIRDAWRKQGLKKVAMNISSENKKRLEELNVAVVQGTIPFFGPSFSIRRHLRQVTSLDLIAKTLELFSTGTLVCLEAVLMAVDAGVIPENEEVVAIAGTEKGLDTGWIIRSSASANLFHPTHGARFVELLAKLGIALQPDIAIDYLR